MTSRVCSALALGLLAAVACPAVQAAVTCTVTNAPTLDFGAPVANPTVSTDSTAAVNVSCSGDDAAANTAVDVCLVAVGGRAPVMRNGRSALAYGLYADSGRTQPLGPNGSAVSARLWLGDRPNVAAQATLHVHGRIGAGQTGLAGGTHTDDVQLRLHRQDANGRDCATGAVQAVLRPNVRAQLASGSCTVVATDLDFGRSHTLAGALDGSAVLGVTCTAGTPYAVALSGGTVAQDVLNRRLGRNGLAGRDTIVYQLYRDSARSQLWGGEPHRVEAVGTGSPNTHVVYGRLPAQSTPVAGDYRDTITATVSY